MGGGCTHVPEQVLACAPPGGFARVTGGMRDEGPAGRASSARRPVLAPVPEIALQIVPVGPGHVKGRGANLPPGASTGGDVGRPSARFGRDGRPVEGWRKWLSDLA